MSEDEFQITIPSNSSENNIPNNTPSHFYTMLAVPKQLDGDWEVAVMEIHYPHTWYNVIKDEYIGILIHPRQIDKHPDYDLKEATHFLKRQMDQTIDFYESDAPDLKKKIVENELYKSESSVGMIVKIPCGFYRTPVELISTINHGIDEAFGEMNQERNHIIEFKLSYDKMARLLKIERRNIDRVQFLVSNEKLREMLGIPETHKSFLPERDPSMKAVVHDFSAIYIYSDIAKYQLVGDTHSTLLGVVPVTGEDGSQQHWQFSPPYYIPVNKKSFQSFDIRLCNEYGEKIPFQPGGFTLCRLNTRRRHSQW